MKKLRFYTKETKDEALRLAAEGVPLTKIASKLGIVHPSSISKWKRGQEKLAALNAVRSSVRSAMNSTVSASVRSAVESTASAAVRSVVAEPEFVGQKRRSSRKAIVNLKGNEEIQDWDTDNSQNTVVFVFAALAIAASAFIVGVWL